MFFMAKVLAFANQKGGVGKTTSAVNVALSLAVSEVKTLLIDLDPQANATTGLSDLFDEIKGDVYDVLIKETAIKSAITKTEFPALDILASTNDLVGAEIELVSVMAREFQLQSELKKIKRSYDIIIIDCPPSLGLLTILYFGRCLDHPDSMRVLCFRRPGSVIKHDSAGPKPFE